MTFVAAAVTFDNLVSCPCICRVNFKILFKDCNGNANYIRVILNSSSFDKLDADECGYISVQKLSGKFTISSNWEDEEKYFYDYPDYGSLNNENDAEEFLELSSNPPELSGEHNKIYTIEFDKPLE